MQQNLSGGLRATEENIYFPTTSGCTWYKNLKVELAIDGNWEHIDV